jgi:DNA replication licensing factor MCM4
MVDSIRAGDRVEVTGIYRAQPMRLSKLRRATKTVFNTYVDAISFGQLSKTRYAMLEQNDPDNFDESTRKELFEISQRKDIYDILVRSLAPSIWENEDVKKGILC